MKHDFKFFVKEGAGNMFSHGFMSFAAIGVTVACLLIMGTFTLVAYNANENLADLQQENAIVAFVDETLDEDQARALQAQVEAVDNVEDCSFVTRTEARDAYVAKYDAEGVYGDLLPEVFRHRYVIHVTDPDQIMATRDAVEQVPGIAKARADEAGGVGDDDHGHDHQGYHNRKRHNGNDPPQTGQHIDKVIGSTNPIHILHAVQGAQGIGKPGNIRHPDPVGIRQGVVISQRFKQHFILHHIRLQIRIGVLLRVEGHAGHIVHLFQLLAHLLDLLIGGIVFDVNNHFVFIFNSTNNGI